MLPRIYLDRLELPKKPGRRFVSRDWRPGPDVVLKPLKLRCAEYHLGLAIP